MRDNLATQLNDDVLDPLVEVSSRQGLASLAERLSAIQRWLAPDLRAMERELSAIRNPKGDLAQQAAAYLLSLPGKRVRPLCVALSARCAGQTSPDGVVELAAAAELVHAATLLHDDVIDQGTERRGKDCARIIYGNSASILAGDHLLLIALQNVRRLGQPELLADLMDVVSGMVAAEALQLERRERFDPNPDIYDAVVEGKTAALFCWAMRAGGIIGGLNPRHADALADAGRDLGIAFQLVDDALDLTRSPAEIGKDGLLDLREGKLTWPLIVACEKDPSMVTLLSSVASDPGLLDDAGRCARLVGRILATDCVEATRARAKAKAGQAIESLSTLPESQARRALFTIVDLCVDRVR